MAKWLLRPLSSKQLTRLTATIIIQRHVLTKFGGAIFHQENATLITEQAKAGKFELPMMTAKKCGKGWAIEKAIGTPQIFTRTVIASPEKRQKLIDRNIAYSILNKKAFSSFTNLLNFDYFWTGLSTSCEIWTSNGRLFGVIKNRPINLFKLTSGGGK